MEVGLGRRVNYELGTRDWTERHSARVGVETTFFEWQVSSGLPDLYAEESVTHTHAKVL